MPSTRSSKDVLVGALSAIAAFCVCLGCYSAWGAISDEMSGPSATRTVKVFQPASIPDAPAPTQPQSSSGKGEDVFGKDWYRSHLSDREKDVYDAMKAGFSAMQQTIEIPASDSDSTYKCYQYVLADRPEIFWVGNSYEYMIYPSSGQVVSITPSYRMSLSEKNAMSKKIDETTERAMEAVSGKESDYETARALYNWVAEELTYDESMADKQVLGIVCEEKKTACAGYSKLYQYLCRKAGISCSYFTGKAKTTEGEILHAWNGIVLDGNPVYVDSTWGDRDRKNGAGTDFSWMALTSKHMNATHTPDEPALAVEADSDQYETWVRDRSAYERYDEATVVARLAEAVGEGRDSIVLFFDDDDETAKAYEALSTSALFPTELYRMTPDKFPRAFTDGVYSLRRTIGLNAVTVIFKYE